MVSANNNVFCFVLNLLRKYKINHNSNHISQRFFFFFFFFFFFTVAQWEEETKIASVDLTTKKYKVKY